MATSSTGLMGADAHDATDFANEASTFSSQGYSFVGQYIDQNKEDANTAGSPSLTAAQAAQESAAGLQIVSIFQTNGMSSSTGDAYQTYFTSTQGASDAAEAVSSAEAIGQPAGSTVYFAMDFDPAIPGAAGSETNLLTEVQSYLTAASPVMQAAGYNIGVYGAGDTLAAAVRNILPDGSNNANYTPVAQYGWLTQSYGWAGSNPSTDANAMGWNITQAMQTTKNGVAIDPDQSSNSTFGQWAVCFASGTLIRTPRGDVAVEDLSVGDLVVTASGRHRPVRWIGHRPVDCRRADDPTTVLPIRIAAGAFGPDRPERDLFVSPGHAICVPAFDEVLIPASVMVNGATVAQVEVDAVTYWHVELGSHDILFANGLPAESFIDVGNRAFFIESRTVGLGLAPDAPTRTLDDYCRPFFDGGPLVEAVCDRLRHRALALGWTLDGAALGGLHLMADGVRIDPDARGLDARFLVPADARDVWLASDASVPHEVGSSGDRRTLGVRVAALTIDDGLEVHRVIALDDPCLGVGFHDVENESRWTDGRAKLPPSLWAECRGTFFLRVDLAMASPARWIAPEAAVKMPIVDLVRVA